MCLCFFKEECREDVKYKPNQLKQESKKKAKSKKVTKPTKLNYGKTEQAAALLSLPPELGQSE